jgi:hypothetical protein
VHAGLLAVRPHGSGSFMPQTRLCAPTQVRPLTTPLASAVNTAHGAGSGGDNNALHWQCTQLVRLSRKVQQGNSLLQLSPALSTHIRRTSCELHTRSVG